MNEKNVALFSVTGPPLREAAARSRSLLPKLGTEELEALLLIWEKGWGEGFAKEYPHPA